MTWSWVSRCGTEETNGWLIWKHSDTWDHNGSEWETGIPGWNFTWYLELMMTGKQKAKQQIVSELWRLIRKECWPAESGLLLWKDISNEVTGIDWNAILQNILNTCSKRPRDSGYKNAEAWMFKNKGASSSAYNNWLLKLFDSICGRGFLSVGEINDKWDRTT